MSRSWNSGLTTMLAGEEITRCFLIELVCPYTAIGTVRLTDHDVDLVLTDVSPSETYVHDAGFTVAELFASSQGNPFGLDVVLPISEEGPIYDYHIRKGAWRKGTAKVWIADFTTPNNRELIFDGFIGQIEFSDTLPARVQLITRAAALGDLLLQTIQPKCSYAFCGPKCGLNPANFTSSATVATVISNDAFTVTIADTAGFDYTRGMVTFTSGNNNGGSSQIRLWTDATALVETTIEMPFDVEVGDAIDLLAGCAQTREACVAYNNIDRFPGFDFIAG